MPTALKEYALSKRPIENKGTTMTHQQMQEGWSRRPAVQSSLHRSPQTAKALGHRCFLADNANHLAA